MTALALVPDMDESLSDLPIGTIRIGERVRKDMGDLDALARSIGALGLLQPIVVTPDCELIAGERRLRACQALGWTTIPVRIAHIDAIALGERDENEVRKDFTVSERVMIAQAVERALGNRQGQRTDRLPQEIADVRSGAETRQIAAERAGFGNRETYRQAKEVVERAAPELVEAVDAGEVSVSAAATVAKLPVEEQRQIVEAGPAAVREAAREIRQVIVEAAIGGLKPERKPAPNVNPLYQPSPAYDALMKLTGPCDELVEETAKHAPDFILSGCFDDRHRERVLRRVKEARDFLSLILEQANG